MNVWENEFCRIAATIYETEPDLLDYRLVEYLNRVAGYVKIAENISANGQFVALALILWEDSVSDNFTKKSKTKLPSE